MADKIPSANICRGLSIPVIGLGTFDPNLVFARDKGKTEEEVKVLMSNT